MATYTDSYGFNKGTADAYLAADLGKIVVASVDLDFSEIAAARVTAGVSALAANDVLEIIRVPADTLVMAVGVDVTTAEGATFTFDLGDGADTNGYLATVNGNTVAASASNTLTLAEGTPNTVTGYGSVGKYYASADTIDIVLGHNSVDTAVMRVWAVMVNCS